MPEVLDRGDIMSYINDALCKAQRENKADTGHSTNMFPAGKKETGKPRRWILAAGFLAVFLLAAAIIALLYWPREKQSLPVEQTPVLAAAPPSAEQRPIAAPESAMLAEMLKAEPEGKQVVRTAPAAPGAGKNTVEKNKVDVLHAQAIKSQNEGKMAQAEALYKQVLEIDPHHLASLNNLGVIYMQQKKHNQAIAYFNDALDVQHNYVDAHYNLACLYARKNDKQQSLLFLKKAIDFNPEAAQWAIRDNDLKTLANLPEFNKLVQVRNK